jgi:hypothetical protein
VRRTHWLRWLLRLLSLLAHRTQRRAVAAAEVSAAPSPLRESYSKCSGIARTLHSAAKTTWLCASSRVGAHGLEQTGRGRRQAQGVLVQLVQAASAARESAA